MLLLFLILRIYLVDVNGQYKGQAYCPADEDCTWKYPYYVTQNLRCVSQYQCPNGYLCCPDCHYQHNVCRAALWTLEKERVAFLQRRRCPKSSSSCKKKHSYTSTKKFECTSDSDCDYDLICCSDSCFSHNICKKGLEFWEDDEDVCPEDQKLCSQPWKFEKTKSYRCNRHKECYSTYACCSDSCYSHKICKSRPQIRNADATCPISIRRQSCPNVSRNLSRYRCEDDRDCVFDYVCCKDNCYDHLVCKLPIGVFSYRSVYKASTFTTLPSFEEQYGCPKVEEKCLVPYSLRLAKKFICFNDGDCKLGQLCCKDSCVKDFKICKNLFTLKPELRQTFTTKALQHSIGLMWTTAASIIHNSTSTTSTTNLTAITVQSSVQDSFTEKWPHVKENGLLLMTNLTENEETKMSSSNRSLASTRISEKSKTSVEASALEFNYKEDEFTFKLPEAYVPSEQNGDFYFDTTYGLQTHDESKEGKGSGFTMLDGEDDVF